ncbi:DUF6585 family protein [Streptomyces sp. NPDC002952]|uniref:DUF6585 family protein n=1 Tax=Streptomyces sp. NPDC002952 TaxID=3364673 RepID=UPI003689C8A4
MPSSPPPPSTAHLPPAVAALAEERQLGRLEREFAPKRMHRLLLALYVVTLLQLLFFVVPGLAFLWWLRRTPEFSRKQAAKRLYLFEHGMIVHPRLGDTVTAIRWDSVRLYQEIVLKIVNGLPTTTTHTYTALSSEVGHAGAAVTDFYADPEVWGPWMQDAVVRAQGRTVLEAVLAGETVAFGPFGVALASLGAQGAGQLPWTNIRPFEVSAGVVRVLRRDTSTPWATVPVSDIANVGLFLNLAENLRQG